MIRWICIASPWVKCLFDGIEYLKQDDEKVLIVDQRNFTAQSGDVIMAPHTINERFLPNFDREGVTFYETENLLCPTNPWLKTSARVRKLTQRPWWNYSAANAAVYGDTARPLQLRPVVAPAREKDIDVLFVGSASGRRAEVLRQLEDLRIVYITTQNPVFMPRLADFYSRSKILLNVHYYMPGVFESFRCVPAVSHGVTVVSETSIDEEGADVCVTSTYDRLADTVRDTLSLL